MPYVTSFPSPGHVHATPLAHMSDSPMHFKHVIDHGIKDTPSLLFGRVVHAMLLGFGSYIVFEGSRNSNAFKAFKLEHEKTSDIIDVKMEERAIAVVKAIRENPRAAELLEGCTFEQEIEWTIGGRKCAGRLDAFRLGASPVLIDVKTTVSSKPSKFAHQARQLAYPAKLAWYRAGGAAAGLFPGNIPSFLIAAESKAPHPVTVVRLTEAALLEGEMQWRSWFEKLLVCEKSNEWPGYTQAIVELDVMADEAHEVDFGDDEDEAAA